MILGCDQYSSFMVWLLQSSNQPLSCAEQVDGRTAISNQCRLETKRLQEFDLQHNTRAKCHKMLAKRAEI